MKMRKLLSIGALTLAIVSCTSVGASAAEVVKGTEANKTTQMQRIVKNGLDGRKVVNNLAITANTKLGIYLKPDAITEINAQLAEAKIPVKIKDTDTYYNAQNAIVKAAKTLDDASRQKAFEKLKSLANDKLVEAENYSEEQLTEQANKYFRVSNYGKLAYGRNMNDSKVVSLVDKKGNVIAQVSGENIKAAKERVAGVNSLDELLSLANKYYPGAEDYIKNIK